MTYKEFAEVMAYIGIACRKPVDDRNTLDIYFDLLGEISAEVFRLAAKRVVLQHPWATLPSAADLKQACHEVAAGDVVELSATDAWAIADRVIANTDPELDGSFERACAKYKAPPLVVETIRKFGLLELCFSKDPVGVVRAQFTRAFSDLQERDRRRALCTPEMLADLDRRKEELAGGPAADAVRRLADSFGSPT